MRRSLLVSPWLALALLMAAAPALAGGPHHRHGGWHGRGHHYGHGHHGGYWGPYAYWGPAHYWWPPLAVGWWWAPPVVERTVVREETVYVEGERPVPQGHWYFCESAGGYYPEVPSCDEAWIPVPPRPQ